jgi:hypothetical protein
LAGSNHGVPADVVRSAEGGDRRSVAQGDAAQGLSALDDVAALSARPNWSGDCEPEERADEKQSETPRKHAESG